MTSNQRCSYTGPGEGADVRVGCGHGLLGSVEHSRHHALGPFIGRRRHQALAHRLASGGADQRQDLGTTKVDAKVKRVSRCVL